MRVFLWLILLLVACYAGDITRQGDVLYFDGDIAVGDEVKLEQALSEGAPVSKINLNSRGGDVFTAMQMGRKIRAAGMQTAVSEICDSACTAAFIGGVERSLEGSGVLGFHRVSRAGSGRQLPLDDGLYNRLTIYAWGKGVDPIRFVQWMTLAGADEIYTPSADELCSAQILKPCGDE